MPGILEELAAKEAAEVTETPAAPVLESEEEVSRSEEGESGEEETIVTIGEEEAPKHEPAPDWVKDVRKREREAVKRAADLQRELDELKGNKPVEVGAKPTLDGCDFDAQRFEMELDAWKERKRKADAKVEAEAAEQKRQAEQWQRQVDAYTAKKGELKAKDFDEIESLVESTLSKTQQGVILQGAENPALIVLALGRNPAKMKELAAIADPVKFSFAVAKLETQIRHTRRPATGPEQQIQPGSPTKKSSPAEKFWARGTFE